MNMILDHPSACQYVGSMTIAELRAHERGCRPHEHEPGCPFRGSRERIEAAREGRLYWNSLTASYTSDPFAGL